MYERKKSSVNRRSGRSYYSRDSQAYDFSKLEFDPMGRNRYISGSALPKIEESPVRAPERRRVAPPVSRPVEEIFFEEESKKGAPVLVILNLVILFFGALMYILAFAETTEKEFALKSLNTQLAEIQNQNAATKAEINDFYDLKEVESYAINFLGMVKPSEHHFINIEIEKESYIARYEVQEVKEELGSFKSFFSGFLKK